MVRGNTGSRYCLPAAIRELIVADYLVALHANGSKLVGDPRLVTDLVSQVLAVLSDVDRRIELTCRATTECPATEPAGAPAHELGNERADGRDSDDADGTLSHSIGAARADAGVSPSQSLAAASLIFAAAFPLVSQHLADLEVEQPTLTAGIMVEAAITSRMSDAATTYVDYLLVKVHRSHRDERRRLARELHDLAAPAVVLGLQHLDMFRVYRDTDRCDDAEAKLELARAALLDALQVIRALSAQSREAVGRGGLRHAISRYAATVIEAEVSVTTEGPLDSIPASYCEELFLVVREAIRNAVTHGHADSVQVRLHVVEDWIELTVTDDGGGFDTAAVVDDGSHLGLYSMRERADLLNGQLELTSSPGGTVVRVSVTLPERRAHVIATTLADPR